MPIKKAKDNYIKRTHNCAQAVAHAFAKTAGLSDKDMAGHSSHGSGGAPKGWCGAAYAAAYILEKMGHTDKVCDLERSFVEAGGSINCKELRANRKLSCVGCVEKAADYLIKNVPELK